MSVVTLRTERNAPSSAAEWLSAAEIAALVLPGLPRNRQDVSTRATLEGWPSRPRLGPGGGREFPTTALPEVARGELIRRRLEHAAQAPAPIGPAQVLPELPGAQQARLLAKATLCRLYRTYADGRSLRSCGAAFVAGWNAGQIEEAAEARKTLPTVSTSTLKRALADRASGRIEKLAATAWGGSASVLDRSRVLSDFVIAIITQRPHLDAARCRDLMRTQFQAAPCDDGIDRPLPSERSLRRWMRQWRERNATALLSITDPDAYRSRKRPAFGRADTDVDRINQLWECDASPADVLLIDGRYSIYVVVDVFSRRLMASVTKTPRGEAMLRLLCRAIMAWGVPEILRTDNGQDFVSRYVTDVLGRLEIKHDVTRPYHPEEKPHVESAIGTIQHGLMELLPGYVGHDVAERSAIRAVKSFADRLGESPANAFAVEMTAADLQARLDEWCAGYEQRTHTTLRTSPAAKAATGGQVRRIADEAALRWLLMPPPPDRPTRKVTRKGVLIGGADFWCDGLFVGDVVHVRMDPDDLGSVWCYRADSFAFIGVARNPERAGLSRQKMAVEFQVQEAARKKAFNAARRAAQRDNNFNAIVRRHLSDEAAPRVVAFPATSVPHTTAALEATAQAAAAASGIRRELSDAKEDALRHELAPPVALTRKALIEESPQQLYERWVRVDQEITRGVDVPAELRRWHRRFATTSEWRSMRRMMAQFAAGDGAQKDGPPKVQPLKRPGKTSL